MGAGPVYQIARARALWGGPRLLVRVRRCFLPFSLLGSLTTAEASESRFVGARANEGAAAARCLREKGGSLRCAAAPTGLFAR